MSAAELKANMLYESYNLASLTQEVKHYLITLLGGVPVTSEQNQQVSVMDRYTIGELHRRANQSLQEYKDGKCRPMSELNKEIENSFPWLQ